MYVGGYMNAWAHVWMSENVWESTLSSHHMGGSWVLNLGQHLKQRLEVFSVELNGGGDTDSLVCHF